MSKIFHLFIICSVLTACWVNPTKSDDEEEEEERPRNCQQYLYGFVEGILKSLLRCIAGQSYFKANSIFEYVTRNACIFKCLFQDQTLLTSEGMLDDIASALYFEETFDGPVRDISLPILQGCFALADEFKPKDYWCKSYLGFTECATQAIAKGLIPYGGDCVTTPVLGIFFSVLKYLAPDSPKAEEEMQELRRVFGNRTKIKCIDKFCTKLYEYKKVNGTKSIVVYNKDMQVLSVENRKTKPKPMNRVNKG